MSGHSKWATIKHKKALTDAKKSKVFSKIAALITVAARERGGDPAANPKLRSALDKAKDVNMPSDNVERAVKRGTGEIEGAKLEELVYEAFGPHNSALLIKVITDNKNRTSGEIKKILGEFEGKMAERGSVLWLFDEKGVARLDKNALSENQMLELIEAGAEDFKTEREEFLILSPINKLEHIKHYLTQKNIAVHSAEPEFIAKNYVEVETADKEKLEKLFEALDEQNETEEVYSNVRF